MLPALPRSGLCALLLLIPAACVQAQATSSSRSSAGIQHISLSGGLGATSAFDFVDLNANLTVATQRYAFSARVVHAPEFRLDPSPRSLTEFGLLAGWRYQSLEGWVLLDAQAGAGVVFDQRRRLVRKNPCQNPSGCFVPPPDDYERYRVAALALPAEVDVVLAPVPYVGLGIRLVADVNAVHSFVGAFVTLHVGRLR